MNLSLPARIALSDRPEPHHQCDVLVTVDKLSLPVSHSANHDIG